MRSISIIIPAYNAETTLGHCLQGLAGQTIKPLEIIVVNDASTDGTVEIARTHNILCHSLNGSPKGPGAARNAGVRIARGSFLAFIDSDCIPPADWLEKLTAPLSSTVVGAVGSGYSTGFGKNFWQCFCYEELNFRRKNMGGRVKTLVSNNFACRKNVFEEVGGFPEEYPVCEDILFSTKIGQNYDLLWIDEPKIVHRFKDTLIDFLRHQYFFARESTYFFLKNPKILTAGTHQGRNLYICIFVASLSILASLAAIAFAVSGLARPLTLAMIMLIITLGVHGLLYSKFRKYLASQGFPAPYKAYGVSLLRDLICVVAVFSGLIKCIRPSWIINRRPEKEFL